MMMMVGTFPVQAEFLAPSVGLHDEAFFSVLLRMAVPDTSFFPGPSAHGSPGHEAR